MTVSEASGVQPRAVLVIGASGGIAQGVIETLALQEPDTLILAVSRAPQSPGQEKARLRWWQCDYSEAQIAATLAECAGVLAAEGCRLDRVVVANGRLHEGELQPEKRIESVSAATLLSVFESNAVVPALWLKHLHRFLKRELRGGATAALAVLSARVGSITDNGKGGWYAYRASKAAVNMLVKTSAIEYQRSLPALRFIAFHPGTTDTSLSKPFQRSVPEGKLFTPAFVAAALLARLDDAMASQPSEAAQFLAYDGDQIPW